nr:DNA mismatch endonuclease Vsr [Duganella fentianensis]
MAGIKAKNTGPEIRVRHFLHKNGFRFRLHRRDLPGNPDIVLPRYRTCIFVHGCFWHRHDGCKLASNPKSRQDFWREKFGANVRRDKLNRRLLEEDGWRVVIVWECGLRKYGPAGLDWLPHWLRGDAGSIEWPPGPLGTDDSAL